MTPRELLALPIITLCACVSTDEVSAGTADTESVVQGSNAFAIDLHKFLRGRGSGRSLR